MQGCSLGGVRQGRAKLGQVKGQGKGQGQGKGKGEASYHHMGGGTEGE